MNTVNFKQWHGCDVSFAYYSNGNPAIRLTLDGDVIATASVNPPNEDDLESGEIAVKDWSENEGMLQALVDAGIVSESKRTIQSGFVDIHVCDLLVNVEKYS